MSWFSSAVKGVGKAVKNVGHAAGSVLSNPWVEGGLGLLTGGATLPLLAGAAGGLLRPGGNIGKAVVGGATGAATGALGSTARGIIPGVGGLLGRGAATGATDALVGDIAPTAMQTAGGGASNGLLGTVGGLIKRAGSYALDNPGKVLTAAQGVNSALDAASARALEKRAMGYATDDYSARAPLRSAGVAGLLAPPVDLSANRAYQSVGNPYAMSGSAAGRIKAPMRRQASS